jgi:hypothetical protein
MNMQTDKRIRAFLVDEARRVTATSPSLDEAVGTLAPGLERRSNGGSRGLVVLFAAALLLAALAASIAVGSGLVRVPQVIDLAPTGTLPAEQTAVVARLVAALNSRDADAFAGVFSHDGAFNPRGTFASSSSLFSNTLRIADRAFIEPFMAINEAWRFEAEVLACDQLSKSEYVRRYSLHHDSSGSFGHCAVMSRWPAISLEIGEWWAYEFNGSEILWWTQVVRDATPADRTLQLGLDGLLEWESWLLSTNPDAAGRLLNPRTFPVTIPCGPGYYADESHSTFVPETPCTWSSDEVDAERITTLEGYGRGEDDWIVAGQRFMPSSLIPYDPALANDIEDSIEEFLLR